MNALRDGFRQIRQYPSAMIGGMMVMVLILISITAVIAIPYREAVRLWRGGVGVWDESPQLARPVWFRLFKNLPKTIIVDTQQGAYKKVEKNPDGTWTIVARLRFDYPYEGLPSEIRLLMKAKYKEAQPLVSFKWTRPDGKVLDNDKFEELTPQHSESYYISRDTKLLKRLKASTVEEALFGSSGSYEMDIVALVFEPDSDFDARLIIYGKVYGIAGTDLERRDIGVALLWGTPVAILFGLVAAVGTTAVGLVVAGVGTWFGGVLDAAIQRVTEVNAMLPRLTLLVMIGIFYSRSIWVMLLSIITLSVFGIGIKTYRSIFLTLKEAPYVEAARAYGAGNIRIIFKYMIPRVIPMLIPAFVTAIPDFVFLEASLAILGLGDPSVPTWGKLLFDAYSNEALFKGHYYWVMEPAALLMITGMSFAMVGFALDRIFNPRLRTG